MYTTDFGFDNNDCSQVEIMPLANGKGTTFNARDTVDSMEANLIRNNAGFAGIYAFDAFYMPLQSNVTVLATDYSTYLVVHTCQSYLAGAIEFMDGVFVYTRPAMTSTDASYTTIMNTITPLINERYVSPWTVSTMTTATQSSACVYTW